MTVCQPCPFRNCPERDPERTECLLLRSPFGEQGDDEEPQTSGEEDT